MSETRFQSSEGVVFDTEQGCRCCWIRSYPKGSRGGQVLLALNAEGFCERCAVHAAVDSSDLTPEVLARIFGGS